MIEATRAQTKQVQLVPTRTLVFYEAISSDSRQQKREEMAYVAMHEVAWCGQTPSLGIGKPCSKRALRKVLLAVAPELKPPLVVIPEHVLAHGGGYVFWWTPPQGRSMFFRNEFMGPDEGKGESHHEFTVVGKCAQPGLVWAWGTQGWKVWAVKGAKRPTAETRLFNAPYFNVFSDHRVCVGNVPVSKGASEDFDKLPGMVESFFGSWFTHPNYGARGGESQLLKHPNGVYKFWRDAVTQSIEQFPEDVLVPAGLSLHEALSLYVNGTRPAGRIGIAQEDE